MKLWSLVGLVALVALMVLGLRSMFRRVTVFEYQHALRFVDGRLVGTLPPGSYWIFTPRTSIEILEARPTTTTVPGQEVLSSDGVGLKVSLLLETRVDDPKAAMMAAEDHRAALYAEAQRALRVAIGERSIEEVLDGRGDLAERLQADVEPTASALGLELRRLAIKDIMFPGTLKEAFSQTARARQEAQAALERARGEQAALRSLANAARLLENNPDLFQLRLLQAAAESGKVVLNVSPPSAEPASDAPGAASDA